MLLRISGGLACTAAIVLTFVTAPTGADAAERGAAKQGDPGPCRMLPERYQPRAAPSAARRIQSGTATTIQAVVPATTCNTTR